MEYRSAMRSLWIASVLAGCAAAPPAMTTAPVMALAPATADGSNGFDATGLADATSDVAGRSPIADTGFETCGADGVAFAIRESTVDLTCDDVWQCAAQARIALRNCRTDAIAATVTVRRRDYAGAMVFRFVPLAPGARIERDGPHTRAAVYDLSAVFTTDDSSTDIAVVRTLPATNTANERARAACVECRGEWGPVGMRQIETCRCRTRDFGRVCEDGRDCEGECNPTGVRITRPASRHGGLMVPALGVRVGRCSEFRFRFGCRSLIPSGERDQGPQPLFPARRSSVVCAD